MSTTGDIQRRTRAQLAAYIGNHLEAAEQLLGAAYPLAMAERTAVELAQISAAHAQLAIAACLVEVWKEDVEPLTGRDADGHPFQLLPGSGNRCAACDGIPGDPVHDPAAWDSPRGGAFPTEAPSR